MSPNVGNFVHDLVEMAKAMETLPQVQAQCDDFARQVDVLHQTVEDRELRILDLKDQINALNSRIHEAEVAKDAAETMFLEADDRTSRALAFVKATFGNAGALIQALEPPRPQPTPEPVPMQAVPEAPPAEVKAEPQGEPSTTMLGASTEPGANLASPPMHEAQLEGTYFKPDPEGNKLSVGLSDPTPRGQSESPLPDVTIPNAIVEASATSTMQDTSSAKPQPFAGLRYYDHPTYVNLSDWLDGGGTDDDYNWRPEVRRTPIY